MWPQMRQKNAPGFPGALARVYCTLKVLHWEASSGSPIAQLSMLAGHRWIAREKAANSSGVNVSLKSSFTCHRPFC